MDPLIAKRYRILSELGRGGMGTVYRVADSLDQDRALALKVLRVDGAITPELQLRFKEEFRAMVKLKHPNTIEVFDYGQLDGHTRFLTMEIVPGQELAEVIRTRPMSLEQFYPVLIQLLQALGFIHARLYVHRDIKAENIRLKADGTLKLMDFGLMDRLGVLSNGTITGTPGYLPPEVARGGAINAASDLYSVGCLAYEMLTGRQPFTGTLVEVVRAHLNVKPQPVRAYRPEVPARLEAIVDRLLEKDPKLRYQLASEVISDLADLAGMQVTRENLDQKKSYLTSSVLVGRDRELAKLESSLEDARAGKGRSVFVGAPAGVGKSRLSQELLLQAKLNEIPVLHGQCLESGMSPYEPLAHALRPVIALSTPEELGRHAPALLKILPELANQGIQPLPALEPGMERKRINDAVVGWLRDVTTRTPLVLFFDDLHWCDPSSLETFNHCIRETSGDRIFCLATFRNDEAPPGSPLWFTVEEGRTDYLKLDAFSLPQMMLLLQAMLQEITISGEFSQFLYDSTAGNAFFITEVMRYLMEEGLLSLREGVWNFPPEVGTLELPTTIESTVVRRLAQLSPEARALAHVASVLGRYPDRETLLTLSGLDEESFFERLDELIERQFILKEEGRYTFPHDRVREALYGDMPEQLLRDIHQSCGEYLERAAADRKSAIINELAYHFSRGRDMAKAYAYLRQAGDQAKASGLSGVALDSWRQAEEILESLEMPDKEVHQVDLWFTIGSEGYVLAPDPSIRALEKCLKVLEGEANVDVFCKALKTMVGVIKKLPPRMRDRVIAEMTKPIPYQHKVRKGLARLLPPHVASWVPRIIECYGFTCIANAFAGRPLEGLAAAERSFALMPFEETPLEGALLVAKGGCLMAAGRYDELLRDARRAGSLLMHRDLQGQPGPLSARTGAAAYQNCGVYQGYRPSEELVEYAVWACEEIQATSVAMSVRQYFLIWYAWTGRYHEALDLIEFVGKLSRDIGAPPYVWALYLRPYLSWQRGEFDEAMALIQQAFRYPHFWEEASARYHTQILKGHVHLGLGEHAAAEEEFEAAEQQGRTAQMHLITLQALQGRAQLAKAKGEWDAALTFLQESYQICAEGVARNPLHRAIAARLLGEIAVFKGDFELARSFFEEGLAIVTMPEQDNLIEQGQLHRASAELHEAQGNPEAARVAYLQAAEIFRAIKNAYLLRPVARCLERLSSAPMTTASAIVEPPLPAAETVVRSFDENERRDLMTTLVDQPTDEAFYHAVLSSMERELQADEVSLFLGKPDLTWVASWKNGDQAEKLTVNETLLSRAVGHEKGIVAIDMPTEFHIHSHSNMALEMPSVLIAPLCLDETTRGMVYVLKRDLSQPYEPKDLDMVATTMRVVETTYSSRRA